jgi:hypothetical protein
MSGLDLWLKQATRHLSGVAAEQVRNEIREHYESGREAAIESGLNTDKADTMALAALGDAKQANCKYRQVMLTSAEARLLRQGNWEAQAICSLRGAKSLFVLVPVLALLAAFVLFRFGSTETARILLIGGLGVGFLFLVPLLPIYTPSRSRIVRVLKWVVLAAMPVLAFWPDPLKYSWLLIAMLWPVFWIEWTRASIRRKLPVAQWPKQLYL